MENMMKDTRIIHIDGSTAISNISSARKLLFMVLLLAVKDRASVVRFEPVPSEGCWNMRYQVDAEWYDMVPAPIEFRLSQELRVLLGQSSLGRIIHMIRRKVTGAKSDSIEFVQLAVAGHFLDLGVAFHPAKEVPKGVDEAMIFILAGEFPSQQALWILNELLEIEPEN